MERKIKTYHSIGQFFDELTRLKPGKKVEFIGEFQLWQEPIQDERNPETSRFIPFEFSYLPDSRIEVILCKNIFSSPLPQQYFIRIQNTETKELIGFHVPIETDSWEAHYKYDGDTSRVRGTVRYSSLVLNLQPNLK